MFGSWSWIVQVKVFWVKLLNRHQDGIDSNGRGFLHSVFLESAYWHYIFLDNVMFRCTNSCQQACPGEVALNYLRNIPLYQLLLHIWPIFVLPACTLERISMVLYGVDWIAGKKSCFIKIPKITQLHHSRHLYGCASACSSTSTCSAFHFDESTGSCKLGSNDNLDSLTSATPASIPIYYNKDYVFPGNTLWANFPFYHWDVVEVCLSNGGGGKLVIFLENPGREYLVGNCRIPFDTKLIVTAQCT